MTTDRPRSAGAPLDVAGIEAARRRVHGAILETPCAFSQRLSELTATRCFLKLENLQMTGSFKERGAANLLLQLDAAERARGVITASAGNHGLAVAYHARRLGIAATIVMPEWAPLIKITSARRHGAEVVLHGANFDEAYARARAIADERGSVFVHPFDDLRVIAGQGTLGLELLDQSPDLDAVVVPVGGGGLIAGVTLAIKSRRPAVRIIGVQSEEIAAMRAARDAGRPVPVSPAATIADGIAVGQVGRLTFELAAAVDAIVTVSEEELANAVLLFLEIEKTVAEGAGAAPLAALVNRSLGLAGARVALVLSGGNIDVTMLSRIIARGLVKDGRLVRLGVLLRDRPGELARLTALIAEARANVVHIEHDRAFARGAGISETEVELTLETSGRDQIAEILTRLDAGGYRVEERRTPPAG
jgi:threonine dehydratase